MKKLYIFFTVASTALIICGIISWLTGKTNLPSLIQNQENQNQNITDSYANQESQESVLSSVTERIAQSTVIYSEEPSAETIEVLNQEYTGERKTQYYSIALNNNEIIVGQSWGFSYDGDTKEGGGCAFIITGPGTFSFEVTDGEWTQYKNINTKEQGDSLLQKKIDYAMETFNYSDSFMKITRIP